MQIFETGVDHQKLLSKHGESLVCADTYELEGDLVRPCEKLFDDLPSALAPFDLLREFL